MFGKYFGNQKKDQVNQSNQPQPGQGYPQQGQNMQQGQGYPDQGQNMQPGNQPYQQVGPPPPDGQPYNNGMQQEAQGAFPQQDSNMQGQPPQGSQTSQMDGQGPNQQNPQQGVNPNQPGAQGAPGASGAPGAPNQQAGKTGHDLQQSALSHLDPRASQVLIHAQEETRRIKQQFIEPEQLLFGLLYDEQMYKIFEEFMVDGGKLSKDIQAKERIGTFKGQPVLSKTSQNIFDQAYRDAKMRGSNFVTPEDLLIVMFNTNYPTAVILQGYGLKKELVVDKLSKNSTYAFGKKSMLEKYGIDLTEEARAGKLDPVAGRDKEIDRLIHIVLRRTKNNPIIIGETGVGKTAIVEGLAQKIVAGAVPKELQDKRLFQLDVAALVAGASHRGEFEERMKGVLGEVLGASNNIILFIDEIHALMGTGEGEGMNAANIIKPYLARGQMQLIGATTTAEYRKNFEKDKAFERRFQPVTAEEPSDENAFEMLKVLKPKYEKFHKVIVPDETLRECVKLSRKYIGERYLPDKAVDLLDEGCSEVKLQGSSGKRGDTEVRKSDIEKVVAAWTGIPITKLTEDESEKLLKLEERIHKRLVDQEEAVVAVAEAVRRGRIGLAAANRPVASFVFLGPTGVGKTELAKTIAELLFGKDDMMARLDMSEYMEKHEVAKLIGAPPGYVGYEEGGQLTEAVRKKPYSIVLLDEIEKAHPDVFNILLQLLEDGRLTDNKGNIISFKNTIVICTSNIGSSLIQQQLSAQDPKVKKTPEEYNKVYKELSKVVKEELIKFFRPELLNRFDEVVIFKPLRPEHMAGIARLGIEKTAGLLKEQGFNLQITDKAIAKLAKDGYDPVYGARPLRRLIQTAIENPIALAIISKKFVPGDTIVIDYDEDTNAFVFSKGNQVLAKAPLSDEQFKLLLLKIADPTTIIHESERAQFSSLHDRATKSSVAGVKYASAILSLTPSTPPADVQVIRRDLEEAKTQGDELAIDILKIAEELAVQVELVSNEKKIILQILHPETAPASKKDQYKQLNDKLVVENQNGNELAKKILSVTEASPADLINNIIEDLNHGKDQENELAMDMLAAINSTVAEEAEISKQGEPVVQFKRAMRQLADPLYLAAPEDRDKFSQLHDKLAEAGQQNNQIASSILAITDITSDGDMEQLRKQLEEAREQGDELAAEILDTIDASIKHQALSQFKYTLVNISNPVGAPTSDERSRFTDLHDKLSKAAQENDQTAAAVMAVTDSISDDDLDQMKTLLEQAKEKGDKIATEVLDAVTASPMTVPERDNKAPKKPPQMPVQPGQQPTQPMVPGQQPPQPLFGQSPQYPFGPPQPEVQGMPQGMAQQDPQNMQYQPVPPMGMASPQAGGQMPVPQMPVNQPQMAQGGGYYPPQNPVMPTQPYNYSGNQEQTFQQPVQGQGQYPPMANTQYSNEKLDE